MAREMQGSQMEEMDAEEAASLPFEPPDWLNALSHRVIGCALAVHRELGPGLLESIYESALCVEFDEAGIRYQRQVPMPVTYKGRLLGEHRLDLLVEDSLILELKSVERFDPVFEAQLLTYLRVTGKQMGLLLNFNSRLLRDGIKRLVLSNNV